MTTSRTPLPKPICPWCGWRFRDHFTLGQHLRDDGKDRGEAGTRCVVLSGVGAAR